MRAKARYKDGSEVEFEGIIGYTDDVYDGRRRTLLRTPLGGFYIVWHDEVSSFQSRLPDKEPHV